jgi:hypothetical protein
MIWKVTTAVFIPVLFFIGNSVIANDKDSRTRDEKLQEKIVLACEKQSECNSAILVTLAEIKGDLKIVKREAVRNGEHPQ